MFRDGEPGTFTYKNCESERRETSGQCRRNSRKSTEVI